MPSWTSKEIEAGGGGVEGTTHLSLLQNPPLKNKKGRERPPPKFKQKTPRERPVGAWTHSPQNPKPQGRRGETCQRCDLQRIFEG